MSSFFYSLEAKTKKAKEDFATELRKVPIRRNCFLCVLMRKDDVYCLKAIVREKDTASARASRLSTAVQVSYGRKNIVTIVTYKTFSVITNVDVFYPAINLFIRIFTRRRCRRPQAQNHSDLAVLTLGGLTHLIIDLLIIIYKGRLQRVID